MAKGMKDEASNTKGVCPLCLLHYTGHLSVFVSAYIDSPENNVSVQRILSRFGRSMEWTQHGLIFEEHAMILNCTAKVVDVIATLFVAGYCSTGLAAVTALTGFALLNAVHDIHQCTVQRLVDAVRPQGTVEVDPDADVHVEETGRSVRVTVSDSTAQNTNSLVLQGASWL